MFLLLVVERIMSSPTSSDYWIGFDLGGTKMLCTVFDTEFKPVGRKRKKTKGHEGVKSGVDRMIQAIHQAIEDAEVAPDQIAGIGIGCPSPIDMKRGVVLDAVNLGWKNLPLRRFSSASSIVRPPCSTMWTPESMGRTVSARQKMRARSWACFQAQGSAAAAFMTGRF